MENKKIPVTLITGYLGAGKTTLLNYVLKNQEGYKVAVIVNDIGEVNIDAELIAKTGVVTEGNDNLVPLSNGCICCTLSVDLMNQIVNLAQSGKFDYILIEASGICEPLPIAQSISMLEDGSNPDFPACVRLDNIVTVVDSKRMYDEFLNGEALLRKDMEEDDIENLLVQQIEFCNTIVLNKVDEVSSTDKEKVIAVIKALQPVAKIVEANYGKVDLKEIFDTYQFDFERVGMSAAWIKALNDPDSVEEEEHHHHHHDEEECDDEECECHHHHHHDGEECDDEECECHHHHHDEEECDDEECECHHHHEHDEDEHHHHHHCHHHHHHHGEGEALEYGITTFVYKARRPFDRLMFEDYVSASWPKEVIRAKGMVWFSTERDMAYLFEQSGRQKTLSEMGRWIASAPKKKQEEMLKENPETLENWDPVYGDREQRVVIIGHKMDKSAIIKALDDCLVI